MVLVLRSGEKRDAHYLRRYRSRAARNYWMAGELGIPFKAVPVIQAWRVPDPGATAASLNTQSPEFLAVNPMGLIPSMDDDGFILHESLAINLYLARKHGGPRFEPYSRETGMDRAADNHYPTQPIERLVAMTPPVATDAVLFLWATAPMLPDALRLISGWGFIYRSHVVWLKPSTGTGYWARSRHELLLIGTRGNIPRTGSGNAALIGRHRADREALGEADCLPRNHRTDVPDRAEARDVRPACAARMGGLGRSRRTRAPCASGGK